MINKVSYLDLYTTPVLTNICCKRMLDEVMNAQIKRTFWLRNYCFFGDNSSPATTVKTNSNVEFEFKYLLKGKYCVVAYSEQFQNSTSTPNEFAMENSVSIFKKERSKRYRIRYS